MPGPDPLLGKTIANKFVVEEFIGGGAMGAVYRAKQIALDKDVAVKVLHSDMARDPAFVARFHREAKASSRLDHPNSVRVLDFGEDDGVLYLAMEYLDGRDLLTVMNEEWPLDDRRIATILSQILAALSVAHDQGIVHRDLKPENIMVLAGTTDDGEACDIVKVCDFGIATIAGMVDDEPTAPKLTAKGLVMGTPDYMSPEQARGEKLDPRTDLYSVGVILYHLLTGRTPFSAESALGIALKHVTDPVVPPSKVAEHVDPKLEEICLRSLEKSRDARFASARQMRAELRTVLEAHGTALPPIPSARTGSAGVERVSSGAVKLVSEGARVARPNATVGFEQGPQSQKRQATVGFDQRPPSSRPARSATVGFESAPDSSRPASSIPPSVRTVERRAATLAALPATITDKPSVKQAVARPILVPEKREHDREAATMAVPTVVSPTESEASEGNDKNEKLAGPGTFVALSSNEIQVMVDEKVQAAPAPKPAKSKKGLVAAVLVVAAAAGGAYFAKLKVPHQAQPAHAQQVDPTPQPIASAPQPTAPIATMAVPTQTAMPTAAPTPDPLPSSTGKAAPTAKLTHPGKKGVTEAKTAAAAPTPEPPPAPTPTPTAAPAPTPTPTPTAAPTPTPTPTPTAAPPPPKFDPSTAAVAVTGVGTTNGLNASNVRNALSHVNFTKCYRDALTAKGSPASGTANLSLSISEAGYVTGASLNGAGFLPTMKGCIESAARSAKVKDVDTGEASANVTLSFSHK